MSRDPIGEKAGLLLYIMCGNNGIGFVDALGLATIPWPPPGGSGIGLPVVPPIGVLLPGDPEAEGPRIAALFNELVAMCPTGDEKKLLSPVMNPPQCCRQESCAEQALVFATEIVHRATLMRKAFNIKHGFPFPGGMAGNGYRNAPGAAQDGSDGYKCDDWTGWITLDMFNVLKWYSENNKLCFRGNVVRKQSWFGAVAHEWVLIRGPRNTAPSHLASGNDVVIDPWPSGGVQMVPTSPSIADKMHSPGTFLD